MKFTRTDNSFVKRSEVKPGQAFSYNNSKYLALDNANKALQEYTFEVYWAMDENSCCVYLRGDDEVKIISLTIEA